eukprot:113447_1
MSILLYFFCTVLLFTTNAQTPNDYLITDLPLFNDSQGSIPFKQYAGYISLKDEDDTQSFFWFVESTNNPATDPLFFWVNGGPGASAIQYGFFTEHGAFRLSRNATSLNLYDFAWNKNVNIVYLDTPSGVGFTYSNKPNGYNCTDNKTAWINFLFLDRFLSVFTDYSHRDLYLSGESYAGHFIPQLAYKILQHANDKNYPWTKNMKGLIIGNPALIGDDIEGPNYYGYFTYLWTHGLLPQTAWIEMNKVCLWNEYLINCNMTSVYNGTYPSQECVQTGMNILLQYNITNDIVSWDVHDIYAPICHNINGDQEWEIFNYSYDPCIDNYTPIYMNRQDVWKAIHVYDEWSKQNRVWPNQPQDWYYPLETYNSLKMFNEFFTNSFSTNWNITVYTGDADTACPNTDTQRWFYCLNRPVFDRFRNWYLYGDVAGSITIYDKIKFETIKYCGHMVPGYCPVQGLLVLQHYLTGRYQLTI